MTMISKSEFLRLADVNQDPAVSIYLPVAPEFPQRAKNVIRLRNLVGDAADQLGENGDQFPELLGRLKKMEAHEPKIADRRVRGMAVFVTTESTETLPLPVPPPEMAVVQRGFHIAPLLAALDDGRDFLVVSVDHERVQLFAANRFDMKPLTGPSIDRTLSEIRQLTELPADVGFHPSGAATRGRPDARHHAQGDSPADYRQVQLDQYARAVAAAVDDLLSSETGPLVPVAEANFLGMFRKHCRYKGLTAQSVVKAPASLTIDEMHDAAKKVAEDCLRSPAAEAKARFEEGLNRGDGTVLIDSAEILGAATEGRVHTAIFEMANGKATELRLTAPRDGEDLAERRRVCDAIAAGTLRHGGNVVLLPAGELSAPSGLAAIVRY